MIKLGITGGIGSGKSTVCKVFRALGVPVFEADVEAKKLMNENEQVKQQLMKRYGGNLYVSSGLNRGLLAEIIFNNKSEIEFVNSIVHPSVQNKFNTWYAQQNSPYVIEEAAILFESGGYVKMDATILVTAPIDERIQRVMQRDNTTREQVMNRINNQWSDEKKIKLATYVINNSDEQLIIPELIKIHQEMLNNDN